MSIFNMIASGGSSGGGGSSSGWTRPSAWPDYDQINISNEECMFFTYDSSDRDGVDFAAFAATCTGGVTVERGYLTNGTWTVDTTTTVSSNTTFSETLPTDRDYTVYKLYPTTSGNHITNIKMTNPSSYNGYSSGLNAYLFASQKCKERYGNLPYCTMFGTTATQGYWGVYAIEAETELNVSGVTNMLRMFQNCYSLQSVDVSGWDTSSVTNMNAMFQNCSSLQSVDVSGWDTSSVTNMLNMFYNCSSLQSVEFGSTLTTVYSQMFNSCSAVTAFTFNVTSVPTLANTNAFTGNNFANGQKILFPSSLVSTAQAATNWSTYASYIDAISS